MQETCSASLPWGEEGHLYLILKQGNAHSLVTACFRYWYYLALNNTRIIGVASLYYPENCRAGWVLNLGCCSSCSTTTLWTWTCSKNHCFSLISPVIQIAICLDVFPLLLCFWRSAFFLQMQCEAFLSVRDMIMSTILSHNGRASLGQVFTHRVGSFNSYNRDIDVLTTHRQPRLPAVCKYHIRCIPMQDVIFKLLFGSRWMCN